MLCSITLIFFIPSPFLSCFPVNYPIERMGQDLLIPCDFLVDPRLSSIHSTVAHFLVAHAD
jgi:ABC-type uncharacterized transport system permease subunit